jgi:hypothetical protein
MGGIDHRFGRSGQWLESRQCQPSEASGIILEHGAVSHGDGPGDLIDHAGGRDWLICHRRLRPPGLLRPRLDGGLCLPRWFFQNSWMTAMQAGIMCGASAKNSSSWTAPSGPTSGSASPFSTRSGIIMTLPR